MKSPPGEAQKPSLDPRQARRSSPFGSATTPRLRVAWGFPKCQNSAIEQKHQSSLSFLLGSSEIGSLLVSLGSGDANDLHLEIIALKEATENKGSALNWSLCRAFGKAQAACEEQLFFVQEQTQESLMRDQCHQVWVKCLAALQIGNPAFPTLPKPSSTTRTAIADATSGAGSLADRTCPRDKSARFCILLVLKCLAHRCITS